MEFSDSVAIIFRIINLALIIGLVAYFFRKKFLNQIRNNIQEKEVFLKNLQNNKATLLRQQKELDHDIEWQNSYAQELLKKIKHWHTVVDTHHETEQQQNQENAKNIEQRQAIQQEYARMNIITNLIAPSTFEHIHEKLIKTFDDPKKSAAYIAESVNRLTKE